MFDRNVVIAPPGHVQRHYHRTEVVERRAPTDESVKLLREMEAAAETKRISSFRMAGNRFNGLVQSYHDAASHNRVLLAVFDINGHRCTVRIEEAWDGKSDLIKLRDAVAKAIANEVLTDMTRGMKL